MERALFFVCTGCLLVFTIQLTTSDKLSLRQGPETPDQQPQGALSTKQLKNCTMCPRFHKPVCASNGRWYHNPCFMACEVGDNSKIGILYEGICRPEHSSKSPPSKKTTTLSPAGCSKCSDIHNPVCGSDGLWYVNSCLMNCTTGGDVSMVDKGRCSHTLPPRSSDDFNKNCSNCTRVYDPVCTTNGQWYYNECIMQCQLGDDTDVKIRYHGKCIEF